MSGLTQPLSNMIFRDSLGADVTASVLQAVQAELPNGQARPNAWSLRHLGKYNLCNCVLIHLQSSRTLAKMAFVIQPSCKDFAAGQLDGVSFSSGCNQQADPLKTRFTSELCSSPDGSQGPCARWLQVFAETRLFTPAADGGAEGMAKRMGVPFLGRIPMDPALGQACELGRSVFGGSPAVDLSTHESHHQNGAVAVPAAGAQQMASSGTLSSLRAIIDQLVKRMQPASQAGALSSEDQPQQVALPASNGAAAGEQQQQQQQSLNKTVPQTVVLSNGDVPLDPDLHYRIHLGM